MIKQRESPTVPIFYPYSKYFNKKDKVFKSPPLSLIKVERNILIGRYKDRPWRFIKDVHICFEFIQNNYTNKAKAFKSANEVS
jgi:hypothetical protein